MDPGLITAIVIAVLFVLFLLGVPVFGALGMASVAGMRGRRKGGQTETKADGFDRSTAETLASLIDAWFEWLGSRNYSAKTLDSLESLLR